MKTDVKALRRSRKRDDFHDTRDFAGKVTLVAQNDVDAYLMSMLYRVLHDVRCKKSTGNRLRLYEWLEKQVKDKQAFEVEAKS